MDIHGNVFHLNSKLDGNIFSSQRSCPAAEFVPQHLECVSSVVGLFIFIILAHFLYVGGGVGCVETLLWRSRTTRESLVHLFMIILIFPKFSFSRVLMSSFIHVIDSLRIFF